MPYAEGRTFYDADSHIMETGDWLAPHADPDIRERLGEMVLAAAGTATADMIRQAEVRMADAAATAELEQNVMGGPKGWWAYGAMASAERSRALDLLGFHKQLVFSTFAQTQFGFSEDMDVLYGGTRAHNRAIAAWCSDDDRMLGVGVVPLSVPARAEREIDEAIALGCKAVWVPYVPPAGEFSPAHPDLDGVWARLSEAGVPFVLHIGGGISRMPKAFHNNGRERPKDFLGGGENLRSKDYAVLHQAPERFITCLVLDGVFERHPTLRGGAIELGAGWVPDMLHRLDHAARSFRKFEPQLEALTLTPSEYIRRAMKFTPFCFEDAGALIAQAGEDLFLFSSDFPHPEGSRDPVGKFETTFAEAGTGAAAKDRFYSGNFAELFGLE